MLGLLRAEITKTFRRRTFWVLTFVLTVLTLLLVGIFFLLPNVVDDAGIPLIGKPDAYLFGASQVLGQTWFPLILATMALAGELATSAWSTALTRNSRRGQHLVARVLTTSFAAWVAALIAIGVFSIAAYFLAEGTGELDATGWWDIIWKSLLAQFTWISIGLAFSAWLRSVGPAIGAALAFMFIDGLLILWSGWREVSLSIHNTALMGPLVFDGGFGQILGEMPSFRRGLAVTVAWAGAALLIAWAGLKYRDA